MPCPSPSTGLADVVAAQNRQLLMYDEGSESESEGQHSDWDEDYDALFGGWSDDDEKPSHKSKVATTLPHKIQPTPAEKLATSETHKQDPSKEQQSTTTTTTTPPATQDQTKSPKILLSTSLIKLAQKALKQIKQDQGRALMAAAFLCAFIYGFGHLITFQRIVQFITLLTLCRSLIAKVDELLEMAAKAV